MIQNLHLYTHLSNTLPKWTSVKTTNISKLNNKSITESSLEIMPAKRTSQVWKSHALQRFSSISKAPGPSKEHAKWHPKCNPKPQKVKKWVTEKPTNNWPPQSRQYRQNGAKIRGFFRGWNVTQINKIKTIVKMGPRDVPGFKAHPKGIQKTTKRRPKGLKML